jgi:3-deoxy-D-manno-octulosonate 8-phosphate phosphatase (KDO 8-P phosphatase)
MSRREAGSGGARSSDLAIRDKARAIRLMVLDVDGVLTDGQVLYSSEGVEVESFSVKDGFGLRAARRAGILTAILSGRRSKAVALRARELGVAEIHQGIQDKLHAYEALLARYGLTDDAVAYMGDDLNDLPLLARAGLSAAPADAADEVKAIVDYVTARCGGQGAVREVIDLILKAQGRWDEAIAGTDRPGEGEAFA